VGEEFLAKEVTRLNEIARGWIAFAGRGEISVQIFKEAGPVADQAHLWFMFGVLIHEYIHPLKDPAYEAYTQGLGGAKSAQGNVLIEGVASLLTNTVWTNVPPKVTNKTLRERVEGQDYAKQLPPLPPERLPDNPGGYYSSYERAVKLVTVVGVRNLYAAY